MRKQVEKWNLTQWEFEAGIGLPAFISSSGTDEAPRPGLLMAAAGLKPKYPVVIIPGFVTSGELCSLNCNYTSVYVIAAMLPLLQRAGSREGCSR